MSTENNVACRMTTAEAWELIEFLAASSIPEFVALANRLKRHELTFPMPTVEAWELVGFMPTSRKPELNKLATRLENQLREIQSLKEKIKALQNQINDEECIEGTGYMCTGCAMPVPEGESISSCCGYPVVSVDD